MVLINGWSFTAFNIRLSFSYSEITKKRYVMICIQSIQRIRRIIKTTKSKQFHTVPIKKFLQKIILNMYANGHEHGRFREI